MKSSIIVAILVAVMFGVASGITVSDNALSTYEAIQNKLYRYAILEILNEEEVVVEKVGNRDANYDSFLEDIQAVGAGACRYGLFDFEYQCQGTAFQKVILVVWTPDPAKIKQKTLYSSSLSPLRMAFGNKHVIIEAIDITNISVETVEQNLLASDQCL